MFLLSGCMKTGFYCTSLKYGYKNLRRLFRLVLLHSFYQTVYDLLISVFFFFVYIYNVLGVFGPVGDELGVESHLV